MNITQKKTDKLGSKTNPYPAGTLGGNSTFAGGWYFRKNRKPGADGKFADDDVAQFTSDGQRQGKKPGSTSGGFTLDIKSLLADATPCPKPPVMLAKDDKDTEAKEKDDQARKAHSIALGAVILRSIAPGVSVKLDDQKGRKIPRVRSDEELMQLASEQKVDTSNPLALMKFVRDNATWTEEIQAQEGKRVLLSDIDVADIPAGELANVRSIATRAIADFCNDAQID
jgi:hypothetical protein